MFGRKKKNIKENTQAITINRPQENAQTKKEEVVEEVVEEVIEEVKQEVTPEVTPKTIQQTPTKTPTQEPPQEELTEERALFILSNHEERLRNIESILLRLRGAI